MNAAAIRTLIKKGLSAEDIAEVAEALERKKDNTAAERQARHRAKRKERKSNARDSNGVTPPIDNTHTPSVLSPNGEKHSTAKPSDPFPKPDWCDDDQVWSDFLKNRKRKRLPNTATAHKAFLDDIARLSDDEWPPGRLLQHATAKGWGAIYDPRPDRNPANDRQRSQSSSLGDLSRDVIATLEGR